MVSHDMNKVVNTINLLVVWRFENFIKKFDIKIKNFSRQVSLRDRKVAWLQLKQKLILHKYVTVDSDILCCYMAIKNIIWKNIINYKATYGVYYTHMIHSGYKCDTPLYGTPCLYVEALLNASNINSNNINSNNNLDILQQKIINYLLLLDEIIVKYLILDLLHISKMYIFDAWLII